ncbi:DUF481 domain-containing protein [Edaphobacter bradus]|uniref:DUF481 domain-containing protein n=1 Tax=Edaphobacter bradus TaxID=2259016 RepID=UPI0021E0C7DE|nr:DUF481 domain-containing protein [Edaphobacter bradus]
MRALWSLAALGLASALFFQTAVAQAPAPDEIVFKNGERLMGTLENGVGNTVIFKSESVGEVTVSLDKVKELRSRGNFVVLKAGEKITRTSKTPGAIAFGESTVTARPSGRAPETVANKDLAYIIDSATFQKEVIENPGPLQGWNGSITGGATVLDSSSYGQTLTLGIGLIRAIPSVPYLPARTRTTFNLLETYGKLTQPVIPQTKPPSPDSVAKTNIFHTDFEHDKYLTPRFYMLGDLSYDHNYSQGLDLQQIYGGGLGYTVFQTPIQELDFKTDIHYERQNFVQYPPPKVSTPNQNLIGSTFGEAYKRNLPYKLLFTESGTYIQSWNNTHAYSAIFASGLTLPTYKRLSLSVNLLDTYLNNPAFGYQKNSLQFVTGVTYTLH